MNIDSQKRKETVDFMQSEIKHIITQYGDRDPGNAGEIKTLAHMQEQLGEYCDEVKSESFPVHPHAFFGWTYFIITFLILAQILMFFSPIFAILSIVIAVVPMLMEFVFYKPFIDPLFEKRTSGNVWGTLKPSGEVKRRIVLNGHSDAVYEWHWHRIGGYKLFLTSIIIPVIGLIYLLALAIIICIVNGPIGVPKGWTLYALIASVIFEPFFICFYFFSDTKTVVPGANDNLTACEMAIGTVKALKESGIRMENTEVVALITGSEEAGLRGAKFFMKNNPEYGLEDGIETIFVTFETLRELDHLVIYNRDMNGITKNDDAVSLLAKQAGEKNGMNLTYGSVFAGATDAAAFSQAGRKATCFAAMAPEVKDYYHTRRDNWDNLSPECLAKVFDITLDMIEEFDKNGLPTVENK
ncbi:MAG: M28 family peptidase [Christensenellales bacterium]